MPLRGMSRIVTPEGDLYVAVPVAENLLERGLIHKDNHGVLNAESKQELERHTAEYGMCDFCSHPEAQHTLVVPDFNMDTAETGIIGNSTGGWAACDTCYQLVLADRRAELLTRSQEALGTGKYASGAIRVLHGQFWKAWDGLVAARGIGAAVRDFIDGTMPTSQTPENIQKDRRIQAIQRLTGMTADETIALMKGDVAYKKVSDKLLAWQKRFGQVEANRLMEMIVRPNVLPPGHQPHWQIALDMKHDAMRLLEKTLGKQRQAIQFTEAVDMKDPQAMQTMIRNSQMIWEIENLGFADDLKHLRHAATYSFNAETMEAIRLGAMSIPHDAPLSSVTLPAQTSGFFWFAEPMAVTSSPVVNEKTNALLWGWDKNKFDVPVLRLSAMVLGVEQDQGPEARLMPSTKWMWPANMTFHQMIELNVKAHREAYGPGGPYEKLTYVVGEEATKQCISELSLFFLMACVWFKQKVLISTPGHVERHARKRYMKDHKLTEPPSVQVIALRQSVREPTEPGQEGQAGERHYNKWRWVVDGHPRLQACGPGLKDHKLIWIEPYPKGDPTKPFKPKAQKVFAVIR